MTTSCDFMIRSGSRLLERLAQELFQRLPEDGLSFLVLDQAGNRWPACPDEALTLGGGDSLLKALTARIDDGDEPVLCRVDDACIMASQLRTETTVYGYMILILPGRTTDLLQQDWDLVEWVLGQVNLAVSLLESLPEHV